MVSTLGLEHVVKIYLLLLMSDTPLEDSNGNSKNGLEPNLTNYVKILDHLSS